MRLTLALPSLAGVILMALLLLPAESSAATADFNGDGKTDILWRHTSGVVYIG
jgi:FG-GAP repeat